MFYDDEPHGVFMFIDTKSFYASCEACQRGYNPMKVPLVVMSEQPNTNGGLVLATSPMAKKLFHLQANVSRQRDLPDDPRLIVVPPRMNLYIQKNLAINEIFKRFVPPEFLMPYSIDESLLSVKFTYKLFAKTPYALARLIQKTIRTELGLYMTVGIGETPVQAKLALDLFAKHSTDLIGELSYRTMAEKVWPITDLTSIWSIGTQMEKRLHHLHINSVGDLARINPYVIKKALGVMGLQLFALAWGVDRTDITQEIQVKNSSIGNSQVLPRDYNDQREIETVIKEIGEQVTARLRSHKKVAGTISLGIGFSYAACEQDGRSGFHTSLKIEPTNELRLINQQLVYLFRKEWSGQTVRHISVYTSNLNEFNSLQLNLFEQPEKQIKNTELAGIVDQIRQRYGFKKLVYANSLLSGGNAINRASLVGGHNGGNAYE
ncbi:Y-family DNA polymerase [Lactiplantibacillus plantarum]|uniref:Y-family DNA polymerase n=1 Tax=Lactiplantibacillus plantarum TaxID=1590 RepID=UPI001BA8E4D5|nr:Y-family DNA polymerase [Lactiplantibacillus plantarum]MBS0955006.1 Y-family DNA polymerase [Lactiplantibacillus plantarum]